MIWSEPYVDQYCGDARVILKELPAESWIRTLLSQAKRVY